MPLDAIEYVVRPYQTRNPLGQTIIPATPSGSRERATITWGAKASMPLRNEAAGMAFEVVCCQENLNEQSRESETKRITQADNSNNYVDVQRPMSVKLQKKDKNKCGDDWDQFSGVGQEISSALTEFSNDVLSGTAATPQTSCSVGWKFQNDGSGSS
jgi:hypothetical protein